MKWERQSGAASQTAEDETVTAFESQTAPALARSVCRWHIFTLHWVWC